MTRIVLLSDTHNAHDEIVVPDGDILIHAGDATNSGSVDEIVSFNEWFKSLPHKHKVFIAGNHDWLFETNSTLARKLFDGGIYLQDSAAEINGLKIYGSPWQPRFYNWAFNLNRGAELAAKWRLIPAETNILITHGPPHGILDLVPRQFEDENTGCEALRERVERELAPLGNLKLHVFGHIHCGYGTTAEFGVQFANAANCDESYAPVNVPLVFDL